LKLTDVSEVRTVSIIRAVMEAVRTSETSVNFNVAARRHISKDSKLCMYRFVVLLFRKLIPLEENRKLNDRQRSAMKLAVGWESKNLSCTLDTRLPPQHETSAAL
jgi:hypothetical protein